MEPRVATRAPAALAAGAEGVVTVDGRTSLLVDRAKYYARRVFAAAGVDVHRAHGSLAGARRHLTEQAAVTTIFDVGANRGQYGWELRAGGYRGRICSFEPLASAFAVLEARAATDARWDCWPVALSDRAGVAQLYVSGNSMSSSLLAMTEAHAQADPASRTVDTVEVALRSLDDVAGELDLPPGDPCGLKIDTQGHEWEVLDGATKTLGRCAWVELELSLLELYAGQHLLPALLDRLDGLGFGLMQLEPVFSDPHTGRLLQVNALFAATAPAD